MLDLSLAKKSGDYFEVAESIPRAVELITTLLIPKQPEDVAKLREGIIGSAGVVSGPASTVRSLPCMSPVILARMGKDFQSWPRSASPPMMAPRFS
jgi:hypothetical protein